MTAPPPRSRLSVGVGAAIVLVLVALGCAVLFSAMAPRGSTSVVAPATSTPAGSGVIFVHILGAVAAPGLYEVRDGSRAVDVVAAAGGFTDDADQTQLNLARFVTDGEQIVVPVVGEAPTAVPGADPSGKVNINSADATLLETLPRVGPAMAARILEWREQNGRFTAIEDLMSVTGIGEKTFDGLKDLVTV